MRSKAIASIPNLEDMFGIYKENTSNNWDDGAFRDMNSKYHNCLFFSSINYLVVAGLLSDEDYITLFN